MKCLRDGDTGKRLNHDLFLSFQAGLEMRERWKAKVSTLASRR